MEIALLGYEKKQRGITIVHDTDLGRIVLDPSEISLQGVEVKAAPIVREADRFIVNVADMPQAIGRTAVEMLKLSPGVWIRDDIAIFGKKGAKVMINNRLLRETGEDLINYLNQIPAEDILRIEIVPNSGAEYDADMTAGIIKITLKRKRDNGIDGAVGIYYSHAFSNASSTTSPSFNLNYRNDRLSLYASMGTWFSKQIIRITESVRHSGKTTRRFAPKAGSTGTGNPFRRASERCTNSTTGTAPDWKSATSATCLADRKPITDFKNRTRRIRRG